MNHLINVNLGLVYYIYNVYIFIIMNKTLELLKERGLFAQCTDIKTLSALMDKEQVTFYVGMDPTFKSLHVGHILPLIALKYLCKAGHKGIVLLGGGTARIGDPSGKTSTRKMLSYEEIDSNVSCIIEQIKSFLHLDDDVLKFENNKTWLASINYIDFLRDVGSHFSVNKMLSFEAYKKRMETGLTFLEFNYQLLQSYDFFELNAKHGVKVQLGGDDQWGNMVAGVDFIRRKNGNEVQAITTPLLTRADGQKMGKSEGGAMFLSAELVSPYNFFQYLRNVPDSNVKQYLLIFTSLSVLEIDSLVSKDINEAKERLSYELTLFIHGKENADNALNASKAAFGKDAPNDLMPKVSIERSVLKEEINVVDLFVLASLAKTKSEARRLIEQGGAFLDGSEIKDVKMMIKGENLLNNGVILRAGKKRIVRVIAC